MPKHKHEWIWLMPKSSELEIEDKVGYALEIMLGRLPDIHICTICRKTGHTIKSHRGGVRVHYDSAYFYDKAKAIADKYGFILPVDKP